MGKERRIRVFISSTFRDMQAERDELVKNVFPRLRKMCFQRDISWGEVDLRWGVNDEQGAEGKVLPICLEEIHRCRPYFIGLLGERYGWIPEAIPQELVNQEPWLATCHGRSVTELEILHGALNDPSMAEHTFFYFRDPAYLKRLSQEEEAEFSEVARPEEIERLGIAEAQLRADERRQKLTVLKNHIRESGLPLRDKYPNPQALGELVLEDLTAMINRVYPEGPPITELEREETAHLAFAKSRTGVYIGRKEYYDRLNMHVLADEPPLVILGEPGSGKSALLANWGLRHATETGEATILHFIGATPESTNLAEMISRLLGELKERFEIQGEIPRKPGNLRMALSNWLSQVAKVGRVVIILDGLNLLEDRQGALDLAWLPAVIPPNVRMILSTIPGKTLDQLRKRGWPALEVEPLDVDERRQVISEYLAEYSKTLSAAQIEKIAKAHRSANPLYLRVLLNEIRLFGIHERLEEYIAYYLEAGTLNELYEKVLERCERDYERERPALVKDALSLLWAARNGLSEVELLELLGAKGSILPQRTWSPLSLALEGSLIERSGLLSFAHEYLRRAVEERYLTDESDQRSRHLQLANFFHARDLDSRKVKELPWQYMRANAWEKLADLLAVMPFFKEIWLANAAEVRWYWGLIESNSAFRVVEMYKKVSSEPEKYVEYLQYVSEFLGYTYHRQEQLPLLEYQIEHFRKTGDQFRLQASLAVLAGNYHDQGDSEEAIAAYKEEERICRALGNEEWLARCLGNQGVILLNQNQPSEALKLYKTQENLCRAIGSLDGLQMSLGNQAVIFYESGDPAGAMKLHKEEEQICRELGDSDGLAASIDNQVAILTNINKLDEAFTLNEELEQLSIGLGNKVELATAYFNKANILMMRGRISQAWKYFRESAWINEEIGAVNNAGYSTAKTYSRLLLFAALLFPVCGLLAGYQLGLNLGHSSLVTFLALAGFSAGLLSITSPFLFDLTFGMMIAALVSLPGSTAMIKIPLAVIGLILGFWLSRKGIRSIRLLVWNGSRQIRNVIQEMPPEAGAASSHSPYDPPLHNQAREQPNPTLMERAREMGRAISGFGLFFLAGGILSLLRVFIHQPIAIGILTVLGVPTGLIQRMSPINPYWGSGLVVIGILLFMVHKRRMLLLISLVLIITSGINIFGGKITGWTFLGVFQAILAIVVLGTYKSFGQNNSGGESITQG